MKFQYSIEIEAYDLTFDICLDPAKSPPLDSLQDNYDSTTAICEVDIDPSYLPMTIEFDPVNELSIAPLQIQDITKSDLKTPFELKLHFNISDPLNFIVRIPSNEGEHEFLTRFEIYAPSWQVFNWGQRILPGHQSETDVNSLVKTHQEMKSGSPTAPENIYQSMQDFFETDSIEEGILEFADELGRWLSAPMYCFLLNRCASENESLANIIVTRRDSEYWSRELLLQSKSTSFEIPSWTELRQLVTTTVMLPHLPELDQYEVLKSAINCIEDSSCLRSVSDVEALWGLEQRYEITENAIEVLEDKQLNTLLAKAYVESDGIHAEKIIKNWIPVPSDTDLETAIDQAKSETGEACMMKWRSILPIALQTDSDQFQYVVSNYLEEVNRNCDYPAYYSEIINQAQQTLYAKQGLESRERTAKHWTAVYQGHRYKKEKKFEQASEAFERAVRWSVEEYEATGQVRFTNLASTLIQLYQTRADDAQANSQFTKALQEIENGVNITAQLEQMPGADLDWAQKCLEAQKHEYQADVYIQTQQFERAAAELGQAIAHYHDLDRENSATYVKNRQRGLQASVAEKSGEYSDAIEKHENVVDAVSENNSFRQFHQARAKICRVKKKIVNRDIEDARDRLTDIEYRGGVAGDEIEYLELLLSVLEEYEAAAVSDIRTTLDKIDELSPLRQDEELRIEYGHDYRPVFVALLTAQRLRQINIDDSIPEKLVDLTLRDVLRPTNIEQIIEQEGLSDIGLEEQWKSEVPIFTLKQYQEVEKSEVGKIETDNFTDIAEDLTGTLEEFLEFIIAYYTKIQYGDEWYSKIGGQDDGLTLNPLVDALNKPIFDDCPWINSVRTQLSNQKYDDIVKPSKEGTIVDVRNDLDHNNISKINNKEYVTIKNDIKKILQQIAINIPVIGRIVGQNEYGAYTVRLFQSGFNQKVEVMTPLSLSADQIYYFPPKVSDIDPVKEIDKDSIVECHEHRVLESLANYTSVEWSQIKAPNHN
jgi:tetratricopeptide (TPR) repeat protein